MTIDTPGFREFAQTMIDWHTEDITPAEVWIGNSGSYAAAVDYFSDDNNECTGPNDKGLLDSDCHD